MIVEAEFAWEGSTGEQLVQIMNKYGFDTYPPLDVLYTLKMSHRFLRNSPAFLKTMRDIQLMRQHGARIPEYLEHWYLRRVNETYCYSHPSLNVKKKDFFNGDGVEYVFDHDSIHEVMKHNEHPAYWYFKEDKAEVMCSRMKFDACSEQLKRQAVLEEAYVLALERSQIPYRGVISPKKSFEIALQKICTSITSGWFREFAWENYDSIMELFDESYADRFWEKVACSEVLPA